MTELVLGVVQVVIYSAARTERRIKTLATVSMVDIGALFRKVLAM